MPTAPPQLRPASPAPTSPATSTITRPVPTARSRCRSSSRSRPTSTDTPWGLDWFVQAGHGGSGNRNCTLAEDATLATPAYPLVYATDGTTLQGPNTSWQNTNPAINPKGRVQGNPPNQVMWRWQSIQEYPVSDHRILRRPEERAAVHGPGVGGCRPRAHAPCPWWPASCRPPSTSRRFRRPRATRRSATRRRSPMVVLLRSQ